MSAITPKLFNQPEWQPLIKKIAIRSAIVPGVIARALATLGYYGIQAQNREQDKIRGLEEIRQLQDEIRKLEEMIRLDKIRQSEIRQLLGIPDPTELVEITLPVDIDLIHFTNETVTRVVTRLNTFRSGLEGTKFGRKPITNEQALAEVKDGLCYGFVSTLLKNCAKGITMRESATNLTNQHESILFKQIFQMDIKKLIELQLKYKIKMTEAVIKAARASIHEQKEIAPDQEKIAKWEAKIEVVQGPINTIPDKCLEFPPFNRISTCKALRSFDKYEQAFTQLWSDLPEMATIQGSIRLPDHIMAFERGPDGFCLFDTYKQKGLWHFQEQSAFIATSRILVTRVLADQLIKRPLDELQKMKMTLRVTSIHEPTAAASSSS